MKLSELLKPGGRGVIVTADREGVPNGAIYAAPRIIDETTVAFGMTQGRTCQNLLENPNAGYVYMAQGVGIRGVRLSLALKEIREADPILDAIRERVRESVSREAGDSIRYVAYFGVTEVRPLV